VNFGIFHVNPVFYQTKKLKINVFFANDIKDLEGAHFLHNYPS